MDRGNLAAILISLIGALGAYAAGRNASKATQKNALVVSATELEKTRASAEAEAYNRARKMDIESIERLERENELLRENLVSQEAIKIQNEHLNADVKRVAADNEELHTKNTELEQEVASLKRKVALLEGRSTSSRPTSRSSYEDSVDYSGVPTDPYMEAQKNGK